MDGENTQRTALRWWELLQCLSIHSTFPDSASPELHTGEETLKIEMGDTAYAFASPKQSDRDGEREEKTKNEAVWQSTPSGM